MVERKNKSQMRESAADKTRRLSIILPEASWKRLDRIRELMEADTATEIVKDSFRLLEYFLRISKEGHSLYIESPDGDKKKLEIFKITTD